MAGAGSADGAFSQSPPLHATVGGQLAIGHLSIQPGVVQPHARPGDTGLANRPPHDRTTDILLECEEPGVRRTGQIPPQNALSKTRRGRDMFVPPFLDLKPPGRGLVLVRARSRSEVTSHRRGPAGRLKSKY